MSFFAIVLAFLLEQVRPLAWDNPAHNLMRAWSRAVRRNTDTGQRHIGWLALCLAALVPALAAAAVYLALFSFSVVLGFVWTVGLLYLTLGFRQFSHHFTAVRDALVAGDEAAAREALAAWRGDSTPLAARGALVSQVIEHSVLLAHRHVFGVLAFFVLGAALGLGPAGAVFYRLLESLSRRWSERDDGSGPSATLSSVVAQAWGWVDHWPVRLTAIGFAMVGNFEESIAAWRERLSRAPCPNDDLLLAAAAGALNTALVPPAQTDQAASPGDAREPQVAHLASLVGLVWRSVVMWLFLLALVLLSRSVA
jgi:adenosylcobinamide-phosphate synthase